MPNWSSQSLIAGGWHMCPEMNRLARWLLAALNFSAETCISDLRRIATAQQADFQELRIVPAQRSLEII
jgi:hypothetical protein